MGLIHHSSEQPLAIAAIVLISCGILLGSLAVVSAAKWYQAHQYAVNPLNQPICDPPNFDIPGGWTCSGDEPSNGPITESEYGATAWIAAVGSIGSIVSGGLLYRRSMRTRLTSRKP